MGLERAGGEDVSHGNVARGEAAADQQRPVAVERLLLRAHQRKALDLCRLYHPVDPLAIERRLRQEVVAHTAVLVARAILGAPAERVSP